VQGKVPDRTTAAAEVCRTATRSGLFIFNVRYIVPASGQHVSEGPQKLQKAPGAIYDT